MENMRNKFVILTTLRTGSTFLRLWLNNHPDIRCHGEIFLRHYNAKDGYKEFCQQTFSKKILYYLAGNKILTRLPGNFIVKGNVRKYLTSLYYNPEHSGPWTDVNTWNEYQPNNSKCKCVGFKIMDSTINDYMVLKKILLDESYRVIVLHRENILNTYLSRLSLKSTRIAHAQQNVEATKIFVSPDRLITELNKIDANNSILQEILPGNNSMLLSYEEMFSNLSATSIKLQNFLGVESCSFTYPKLKKVNPSTVADRIENYHEVAAVLHNTDFEKFLI